LSLTPDTSVSNWVSGRNRVRGKRTVSAVKVDSGMWRAAATLTRRRERDEVARSLRRQALRLEEHDDPRHPIVAAAKLRIEELAVRRAAVDEAIEQLGSARPVGARPDEIEAMLDAVPDLRPALASADPERQADIFERFDVMAVYDKPNAYNSPRQSPLNSPRPLKRHHRHGGGGENPP
jgi:hypothetical protein